MIWAIAIVMQFIYFFIFNIIRLFESKMAEHGTWLPISYIVKLIEVCTFD